jgi:hypothetical protein
MVVVKGSILANNIVSPRRDRTVSTTGNNEKFFATLTKRPRRNITGSSDDHVPLVMLEKKSRLRLFTTKEWQLQVNRL